MSLPSRAVFHLLDGTDKVAFCNIGWIYDERYIPRTVAVAMEDANLKQEDWYSVTLYEETYTKAQLNDIMRFYKIMSYNEYKIDMGYEFTEEEKSRARDYFRTKYNLDYDEVVEATIKRQYDVYLSECRDKISRGRDK